MSAVAIIAALVSAVLLLLVVIVDRLAAPRSRVRPDQSLLDLPCAPRSLAVVVGKAGPEVVQ
ncbi:hypothetical protein ATO13_08606 [Stappia sp. 22II-S9-Z10]|nr:hypothetical protein ATO13_08606 [Stappia sp. 22II-S9-Z10]